MAYRASDHLQGANGAQYRQTIGCTEKEEKQLNTACGGAHPHRGPWFVVSESLPARLRELSVRFTGYRLPGGAPVLSHLGLGHPVAIGCSSIQQQLLRVPSITV